MKIVMTTHRKRALLLVVAAIMGIFPALSAAQGSQGQDAVYSSSGITVGSSAFIEANKYLVTGQGKDLCDAIYYIFQNGKTAPGGVIDARGIGGSALTCSYGSPWTEGSNSVSVPSTILLPAGTIVVPTSWILPSNTHLVGIGDGIPSSGFTPGTTIQAASGFNGSIIQFGTSTACLPPQGNPSLCSGFSVERLTLDGDNQFVNGIVNQYGADPSNVDHVSFYRVLGTGLSVSGVAANSGPYANITFDTGGSSGNTSTACASINGVSTRGIHGLTCTGASIDSPGAVLLDASNNSIEDVRIVGFYDGILVGSQASAHSNVLLNIVGDTATGGLAPPVHVVHISSNNPVTDISMMGVNNVLGSPTNGEYSIEDDVTSTTLADVYVAVYALGEGASGGHSRFTTSPNAATWAKGSVVPSGACSAGSLYSNTAVNSSTQALYVCLAKTSLWQGVK